MTQVLIIGAGFAGLGAAIRLRQAGITDVVILERAGRVGGTWRDNTYPGAACDVPSLLYSFSFAPNPRWSRAYSGGAEIQQYIEHLVERYELLPLIHFDANVASLAFDAAGGTWTARIADGRTFTARAVIQAAGPLANASLPAIRGLETFNGKKIHSAKWDHGYDLADRRIAVIGTGASAVQIIPEIVTRARSVKVFQRTPGWILPKPDYTRAAWAQELFARVPIAQRATRAATFWSHEIAATGIVWNTPVTTAIQLAARRYLHRQVKDPWLRRQLTPEFRPGCKRMLLSNDYYAALQRENCKLITWPIANISPAGIRTADGIEHAVDCIVFATGFEVSKQGTPFPIFGRDGRSLGDEWARGAHAYKSMSVAGFPNLLFTCGPNSGPGHNSLLVYLEAQLDYAVRTIRLILDRGLHSLDVLPERQAAFNASLQRRLARTTWNSGCRSWYLNDDGFNATMFPGTATQFARQLGTLEVADYDARAR